MNDIEENLLEILVFIKNNIQYRADISNYFIDRIHRKKIFPLEIIIFAMRELQWPEIKEAALDEINAADDPRIISAMNHILEVYDKEWQDAEMYKYYSNK